MGSDLKTLMRSLRRNGSIRLAQWPNVGILLAAGLLRWPFSALEQIWVHHRLSQCPVMPAPVFIVGHWRSGTTFLYNLLSQDPTFNYISPIATGLPWDFLLLATLLKPVLERALPNQRFIDRVPVRPDSPQEDEIGLANMQTLSFYHGLYFPQHFQYHFEAGIFLENCLPEDIEQWQQAMIYYFQKHHLQAPSQRLLIKNPVYTARIKRIRSIWPDAKFIHIYRNPYIVFQSMRNFYQALFRELALQPFEHIDIDQVILTTYPKMMMALERDRQEIPSHDFIEVQFEDLEANPLSTLATLYHKLDLEPFVAAKPYFESYLETQGRYRKNRYDFSAEDHELVEAHWPDYIEKWGYTRPN